MKNSLPAACFALLKRDLRIAYRSRAQLLYPPGFLLIAGVLFAAATPADAAKAEVAAAVIWVLALLTAVLAADNLRRVDFAEAMLAELLLSPHPTCVLVLASVAAHWLVAGLPVVLVAPLLAGLLNLPAAVWAELIFGLALGTPTLCLIGGIGVALTREARGGAALVAVVVLPLYIPVLIFGGGAVHIATLGLDAAAQLMLLGALLLLAIGLAPLAIAAALRATYA